MQIDNMAVMTTEEFCEKAGLSKHQLHNWLESGLLEAKTVNGPDGPSQEFDASQLERARLLKTLLAKLRIQAIRARAARPAACTPRSVRWPCCSTPACRAPRLQLHVRAVGLGIRSGDSLQHIRGVITCIRAVLNGRPFTTTTDLASEWAREG
jgi:hypothetical protein